MKKIRLNIILVLLVTVLFNTNVFALSNEDIHSREAYLVNMNTDEVLFSKNTNNNPVPIASLTKLMTYAVVLDEIPDLENTKIVVPDGLVQYMKSRGASRADLIDGYEYSALDLLYGMMLPSGCDAAETLARYVGGGDPSVFVQKMNQKAQALGMYNTTYIDSYGIGNELDNISTEQDQYILIKYLYNKPYFRQIISTEYHTIIGTKDELVDEDLVRNTNYLMGEYSGGEYYNPYSIGGKTGSLDVAGKCLVTIASKGNLLVTVITLGVPNEYGDYNLTDNNKLLDYAFNEHSQNITIDIGPEFRSVEKGKQLKIEATTSSSTFISWTSSDPSVATVDGNGIVTALSQGQTKITATTETGNLDYTYVSVDFYNGVHTKSSSGKDLGNKTYDPIDYSILKNKGYDYVILRAGYGPDSTDKTFMVNLENALDNNMNVGIWFEGYAENIEEATDEANNLVSILNSINIPNLKDKLFIPIMYSLINNPGNNPEALQEVINTFKAILNNNGYDVMIEIGKTNLSKLDVENLKNSGIDLAVVYRQILPDYKTTMNVNGIDGDIWNYKVNSYLDKSLGPNNSVSLMYMKYKKIETIHKVYIPEETNTNTDTTNNTSTITNTNKCTNTYKLTNIEYYPDTNNDKNIITIKTKDNNKKTTKDNKKEIKEEDNNLNPLIFIPIAILLVLFGLVIYLRHKSEEE